MTRKRRRLYLLVAVLLGLGAATVLVLTALEDNVAFFYSPSDLKDRPVRDGQNFRLGGLVEAGSVIRGQGSSTVTFTVTDGVHATPVRYTGVLPDLFREGQGVVAQGKLADGVFVAREVLAKHDETYMPPEVADAMKRAGTWKGDGAPGKATPTASAPAAVLSK